jgi:hypothetical protein
MIGEARHIGLTAALGLAFGLALAACSSSSKTEDVEPNIFPAKYKDEVIATLTPVLSDPTNLRDTFISEPALTAISGGKEQRYTVCVRYNQRDPSRRYMGVTDRIGYFYGGHLNQLIEATKEQCGNAAYRPFPELAKLCQATKCD